MIEVIVSDRKTHATKTPSFEARIFAGPVLCRSQTPVYDAARELLKMGYEPETLMVAYHERGPKEIFKPLMLAYLARWRVEESQSGLRLREWVPHHRESGQ